MNTSDYIRVKNAVYSAVIFDTEKGEIIGFDPAPLVHEFRSVKDWETFSEGAAEMGRRGELWGNLPEFFAGYAKSIARRVA